MNKRMTFALIAIAFATSFQAFARQVNLAVSPEGPLRDLVQAQQHWRNLKLTDADELVVTIRNGTYVIEDELVLNEEDATAKSLTIQAEKGAKPVFKGAFDVPLANFNPWKDNILRLPVTWKTNRKQAVVQVFGDGKPLTRARMPSLNPDDIPGSYFYVNAGAEEPGTDYQMTNFSGSIGFIHSVNDKLTYKITVPESGSYTLWMRYAADNRDIPNGMSNRCEIQLDDAKPQLLTQVPDTGSWGSFKWNKMVDIDAEKGTHLLTWRNLKGGGLNLQGLILTTDKALVPEGTKVPQPKPGTHLIPIDSRRFEDARVLAKPNYNAMRFASKTAFEYKPGDLKPEWATPETELKIYQSGSCRAFMEIVGIKAIMPDKNLVLLQGKECQATLNPGDRYFLENHLDFLDAPGEWYCDGEFLYLIPTKDLKTISIDPGLVGTPILLKCKKSMPFKLTIDDLAFTMMSHSRQDGCVGYSMGHKGVVEIENAMAPTVTNCTFKDIGRYAVSLKECTDASVTRNTLERSCMGGIFLQNTSSSLVAENDISDLGSEYKHIGGIVLTGDSTSSNRILKNKITNSSRYGITLKNAGFKNEIAYNDIQNTSLETDDTGGIEVTQGNRTKRSGSHIHHNRVRDSNGVSYNGPDNIVSMSWGIYLDSFAGGYTVENNLTWRNSRGGFMVQGGKDNVIRNNIFAHSSSFQGHFNNFSNNSENIVFENNIIIINIPLEGRTLFYAGKNLPNALKSDNNLFWSTVDGDIKSLNAFKNWNALGFDKNSIFQDPMLEDPTAENGKLKPDSPAFKIGFKPIDFTPLIP